MIPLLAPSLLALFALAVASEELPLGCGTPDCQAWIWPLSGPVFEPRRLLNTHGQFEGSPASTGQVHEGIDVQAGLLETVRAITDGEVVSVGFQSPSSWQNFLVISSGAGSEWGILYHHLTSLNVDFGDHVFKGQMLGRVATNLEHALVAGERPYNHLHLALVKTTGLPECSEPSDVETLGNPLPFLSGRRDVLDPVFETPQYVDWVDGVETVVDYPLPMVFVVEEDSTPIELDHSPVPTIDTGALSSPKLSILVRVHDLFDDTATGTGLYKLAPLRLGVTVRKWSPGWVLDPFYGFEFGPKPDPLVYCNDIEFRDGFPPAINPATNVYHSSTTMPSYGNQFGNDMYFDLTNSIEAKGTWDTSISGPGAYIVTVTAEDASGNISAEGAMIEIK